MWKTIGSTNASTLILIWANIIEIVDSSCGLKSFLPKFKKIKLTKSKILAKLKSYINVKTAKFLYSQARITFSLIRKTFTKSSILGYFDLKYHI